MTCFCFLKAQTNSRDLVSWFLATLIHIGNQGMLLLVVLVYIGSHSGIEKNRLICMENKCIMVEDQVDSLPVMHQSSKAEKATACIVVRQYDYC